MIGKMTKIRESVRTFGNVIISFSSAANSTKQMIERLDYAMAKILLIFVKVAINFLRDAPANAFYRFKVGQPRAGNAFRRSEMQKKRFLPFGADSGDLVER